MFKNVRKGFISYNYNFYTGFNTTVQISSFLIH